jgi:phosphoglycolate phosphatase
VTADETVYIGDSEIDIETAANAGVACISVAWGFRERDWLISHGAKTIIDSPEELESFL